MTKIKQDWPIGDVEMGKNGRYFRKMIDALPMAAYTTDVEGRLTYFNPAAVEFSGREPELASDQWCVTWKLFHPDGTPMPHDECPMAVALKEGRSINGQEAIAERPDGKRIWFEAYPSPLRDDEGKIIGGINLLVDVTKGKQAEKQLRRSEEELTDFFENATIGLHWVGRDGTILRANQAELDLLGYTREEYVGRHIADFYPNQDEIDDILRRLRAGEELHDYEARMQCKDGSIRHVLISTNVLWEEGEFIHTRCFTRDITERKKEQEERKRAEQAMQKSERWFRQLLEKLPAAAYTCDSEGLITYFNQQAAEVWGREPELNNSIDRFCGSVQLYLSDGSPISHNECWMALALKNEKEYNEKEIVIERPDGQRVTALAYATPIQDESGELIGAVNIVVDIGKRKQMEEALRESEAQLEVDLADSKLLQSISAQLIEEENTDALYEKIIDAAATIMRSEYASMQMLYPERGDGGELRLLTFRGFSPQAAELWEWVSPASASVCGMALRAGERVIVPDVEQCEPMAGSEDLQMFLQTGICAVQTTPLFSRNGQMLGMISTQWSEPHEPSERDLRLLDILARQAADLIERKQAREELQAVNETLEKRVEERTEALLSYQDQLRSLASELSKAEERERQRLATELHDNLGQMLAVGKMKLDLLQRNQLPDRAASGMADLAELVDDAISYTRELMSDLKPPPTLDKEDLAASIGWMANKMKKHDLEVTIEDDGQPKPLSEEVRTTLRQCVRELLFNVVKHAGVNEAQVALSRRDDRVQVTVEDRGKGFDIEGKEPAPTEEGGFGLFNIHERMDLLGGSLEIISESGKGTKMILRVPAKDEDKSDIPVQRDEGTSTPLSRSPEQPEFNPKIRVLLADDHKMMREGLRKMIEEENDLVVIAEASDGEEAVKLARETSPDVIVMDVNMPGMNGIDATGEIISDAPQMRIIGLSLQEEKSVARTMRDVGASAYLKKSEVFETLCATIRSEGKMAKVQ